MKTNKLDLKSLKKINLLLQQVSVADAREYGAVGSLYHLAKEFGLIDIIDEASGKRDQGFSVGQMSVIMAINRIVEPKSKRQIPEWYSQSCLPMVSGISEVNYNDLLRCLEYLNVETQVKVEQKIYHKLCFEYNLNFTHFYWDTTNSYFEGEECVIAARGFSKDHRPDLVQIGFELGLCKDEEDNVFPTYSRSYEGNISDKNRFNETIDSLSQEFPNFKPTMIFDRGGSTIKNLGKALNLGYHIITALALNSKWLSLLQRVKDFSESFNYKGIRYKVAEVRVAIENHMCKVITYYSVKKAKEEANRRENKIQEAIKSLEELRLNRYKLKNRFQVQERVKRVLEKYGVSKFLNVQIQGSGEKGTLKLFITRNKKQINLSAIEDGKFMLLTDREDLSAKQVLEVYRSHDHSEKAFSVIKGPIKLRPVFHYSEERVRGHIFICVLAFFLWCFFNFLLHKANSQLSVQKAINLLSRIKLVKLVVKEQNREFFIWKLSEIGKQVQEIFSVIGFSPPKII